VKTWIEYVAKNTATSLVQLPVHSVTAVSKWVIRVKLASPSPVLPLLFSDAGAEGFGSRYGMVASPHAVKIASAQSSQDTILTHRTFGAGPYVLDVSQSAIGDHCTLVPNKFYYDKSKIRWGKIITKAVSDPNALLAALRTGQVDVAVGMDPQTALAASKLGFKGAVNDVWLWWGLGFMDHGGKLVPALGNIRVRQALNYAIDRKTIQKALFQGPGYEPASTTNPGSDGDDPKYSDYYTYNPTKAKALLAAAGYPHGFTFTAVTLADGSSFAQAPLCQAIAKYLAAVGVTMRLDEEPNINSWLDAQFNNHAYPAGCFPAASGPSWWWYQQYMKPNGLLSDQHGWHDPVTDRLWLKAQRLPERKANPLWRQMITRSVTQAYFMPVVAGGGPLVYNAKRVSGIPSRNGQGGDTFSTTWHPGSK